MLTNRSTTSISSRSSSCSVVVGGSGCSGILLMRTMGKVLGKMVATITRVYTVVLAVLRAPFRRKRTG